LHPGDAGQQAIAHGDDVRLKVNGSSFHAKAVLSDRNPIGIALLTGTSTHNGSALVRFVKEGAD
jgi:anaerobic selenocysteine-containing dehydrogenase